MLYNRRETGALTQIVNHGANHSQITFVVYATFTTIVPAQSIIVLTVTRVALVLVWVLTIGTVCSAMRVFLLRKRITNVFPKSYRVIVLYATRVCFNRRNLSVAKSVAMLCT